MEYMRVYTRDATASYTHAVLLGNRSISCCRPGGLHRPPSRRAIRLRHLTSNRSDADADCQPFLARPRLLAASEYAPRAIPWTDVDASGCSVRGHAVPMTTSTVSGRLVMCCSAAVSWTA